MKKNREQQYVNCMYSPAQRNRFLRIETVVRQPLQTLQPLHTPAGCPQGPQCPQTRPRNGFPPRLAHKADFKWQCHEISWQFFYLKGSNRGPNEQKRSHELFRFCEDFRNLSSTNSTPRNVSLRRVDIF